MRTFTIEPRPNAHFESCRNHLVLRGNDGKIHGISRSRKKLRIIKEKMEKYYLTHSC